VVVGYQALVARLFQTDWHVDNPKAPVTGTVDVPGVAELFLGIGAAGEGDYKETCDEAVKAMHILMS